MWLVLSFIRMRRLLYLFRTQICIQTNSYLSTEIPKPQFHIPKQDFTCWNCFCTPPCLVQYQLFYLSLFGVLKPNYAFNYCCFTFEIENWIVTFTISFFFFFFVTPSFKPVFHILNYYFSILKRNVQLFYWSQY